MAKEPLKVLTESMFYVLLSLLRQERCGTEIVQFVDDTTAGRVSLGPGTLYTLLKKMCANELISQTLLEEGKKRYTLTEKGRTLLRHELKRRETIVEVARRIMQEKGI